MMGFRLEWSVMQNIWVGHADRGVKPEFSVPLLGGVHVCVRNQRAKDRLADLTYFLEFYRILRHTVKFFGCRIVRRALRWVMIFCFVCDDVIARDFWYPRVCAVSFDIAANTVYYWGFNFTFIVHFILFCFSVWGGGKPLCELKTYIGVNHNFKHKR